MGEKGKFDNIESGDLSGRRRPLESYDWLVITDDDISFRPAVPGQADRP